MVSNCGNFLSKCDSLRDPTGIILDLQGQLGGPTFALFLLAKGPCAAVRLIYLSVDVSYSFRATRSMKWSTALDGGFRDADYVGPTGGRLYDEGGGSSRHEHGAETTNIVQRLKR